MNIREHILKETDDFVALNKPAGLLTIPDREGRLALKNALAAHYGEIFTVHRLDKDTSGLIVFARNAEAHKQLSVLFEGRDVEKYYFGFVLGKPPEEAGSIDVPIGEHPGKRGVMTVLRKGKPSLTDYTVLESFRFFSWMEFRIHTGRTHQIRVHMKHLGHPIVCDDVYGDGKPVLLSSIKKKFNLSKSEDEERPILSRLALHSARLRFTLNGEDHALEAPLPKDLRALLQQLQKNK
ncbi:MAG TPA: RluA family pseudouridine synthase [Chitinophagaceae bacterium]|jgi:23S rRNA pseudouridine955/2504/2580 synthase/23S rRNA pseudouridine1911/1915/1917 synthase|nr:RluA family pseudouridine synthase [Chitinophagaceae bacterium]